MISKNNTFKDKEGRTPLHDAAEFGHLQICKLILEVTKDRCPKTRNGLTPQKIAAQAGHSDIERLILCFDRKTKKWYFKNVFIQMISIVWMLFN